MFNAFREVPNDQKRQVGQLLNELKEAATVKINELKESLENSASAGSETDLTRSADPILLGTRHPLSIVKNEIVDIFARIGFTIAEGPEVEDDWHDVGCTDATHCAGRKRPVDRDANGYQ